MTPDPARAALREFSMRMKKWRDDDRAGYDSLIEIVSDMEEAADALPALAGEETPAEPTAHTLTLEFRRFLTQPEWREVIELARTLPYVQGLRADAVGDAPAPKEDQ